MIKGKILALTISNELKSIRNLGFESRDCIFEDLFTFKKKNPNTVVARFGNSYLPRIKAGAAGNDEYPYVLNASKSIILNCSKNKALKVLSGVVKTPKVWEKYVPKGKLVVVRRHEHSSGSGFKVATGPLKLNSFEHALEYIKSKIEFRCWFAGNAVMTAQRVSSKNRDKYPCRSEWGYKFVPTCKRLKNQVIKASKALGLDFGAMDLIKKGRNFYFLEGNSAATNDHSKIIKFYNKNIPILAKKKFPQLFKKVKLSDLISDGMEDLAEIFK